jgi:hypothetical protein
MVCSGTFHVVVVALMASSISIGCFLGMSKHCSS